MHPLSYSRGQSPGAAAFAFCTPVCVLGCIYRRMLCSSRLLISVLLFTNGFPTLRSTLSVPKGQAPSWLTCRSATALRLDLSHVPPRDWAGLRWLSCTRPSLGLPPNTLLHLLVSSLRARRAATCLNLPSLLRALKSQQFAEPGWWKAVSTKSRPRWTMRCDDARQPQHQLQRNVCFVSPRRLSSPHARRAIVRAPCLNRSTSW